MVAASRTLLTRRQFLARAASAATVATLGNIARPYLSRAASRPRITHGIQSGDVSTDSGVVWARTDRPSRMLVEAATTTASRTSTARSPSTRCRKAISPPRR